jgi:hypothetical protein
MISPIFGANITRASNRSFNGSIPSTSGADECTIFDHNSLPTELTTEECGGRISQLLADDERAATGNPGNLTTLVLNSTRNTTRDYLDTVVLFERLGEKRLMEALQSFDEIYRQPTDTSPLAELCQRLAAAAPHDQREIDLKQYRGLRPPWNEWHHVMECGRRWAAVVAGITLQGERG